MVILSIHDGHDSGACLFRDGEILAVSNEERRRNHKNWVGAPEQSVNAVLNDAGLKPSDVDRVALVGRLRTTAPSRQKKRIFTVLHWLAWLGRTQWGTRLGQALLAKLSSRRELIALLQRLGLANKPRTAYDHHLTHAACAFFHRPWRHADPTRKTLILTLDGAGDGICATVSIGDTHTITRIAQTPKYHSLPHLLYSGTTFALGLKPYEHEYKVMGLAPYGQAEYVLPLVEKLFSVAGLEFRNHSGRFGDGFFSWLTHRLAGQRFDNIAAACQRVFETLVVQWVTNCVAATGLTHVVAAGGAFLNIKANGLIRQLPQVEAFYAYPASDDGGTPIGAALLDYLAVENQPTWRLKDHMYLGLAASEAECEAAITAARLPYRRMTDPALEVAELLATGKIVARFAGREEIGPRALGNRSILADPRRVDMIRKINFAIKHRDFWMPFAPAMLPSDAQQWLNGLSRWPYYMIEAFDTKPGAWEVFPAAMHPFDATARPQVVTDDLNPEFAALLKAFKAKSGVGVLLNTSFNLHGYPIVGSPQVAVDTLMNSDLDALALGPFLVTKL